MEPAWLRHTRRCSSAQNLPGISCLTPNKGQHFKTIEKALNDLSPHTSISQTSPPTTRHPVTQGGQACSLRAFAITVALPGIFFFQTSAQFLLTSFHEFAHTSTSSGRPPLPPQALSFLLLLYWFPKPLPTFNVLTCSGILLSESVNSRAGTLVCFEHKCVSSISKKRLAHSMYSISSMFFFSFLTASMAYKTSWARDQTCTELSIFCPVLSLCALVINPPSLPSFTLCCFSQALVNFLQFPIVTGSLLHPSGLPTPPHQVPNSYDIRPWSDSACIWYLDPPLTSSVTLGKLLNFPVPQFPYL